MGLIAAINPTIASSAPMLLASNGRAGFFAIVELRMARAATALRTRIILRNESRNPATGCRFPIGYLSFTVQGASPAGTAFAGS